MSKPATESRCDCEGKSEGAPVMKCTWFKALPMVVASICLLLAYPRAARAIVHEKGYGEPYDVHGKRIVFTTWYWVRPGLMDWRDDNDKSVFADKKVMA